MGMLSIFRRRPITEMLVKHSIPTPSRLMADLLALKIAQLPNDYENKGPYKANEGTTKIMLADGRSVHITKTQKGGIRVTLCPIPPANGSCRTNGDPIRIDLSEEEQNIIMAQFEAWQDRAVAEMEAKRDHESQLGALAVVESLIGWPPPRLEA